MPVLAEHWTVGLEGILVSQILSLLTLHSVVRPRAVDPSL